MGNEECEVGEGAGGRRGRIYGESTVAKAPPEEARYKNSLWAAISAFPLLLSPPVLREGDPSSGTIVAVRLMSVV